MNENPADKAKQDALYEDREPKKIIRLITVTAYMISVSFVGMTLSTYYIFLWNPPNPRLMHAHALVSHSGRLVDDGLTASRMIDDRASLTADQIDLFSNENITSETLKARREIVDNVNAILRDNFEKSNRGSERSSVVVKGLLDQPLFNDTVTNRNNTSLLLDNITESNSTGNLTSEPPSISFPSIKDNKLPNNESPYSKEPSTPTNSIHSTLPVEIPSLGDNLESTVSPPTVLPTKWMKNLGKKQHQTPFALKHLQVPIKFDGLRKRPIRIITTTTTRPLVSLDSKETSLDRTTPPVPTAESSSKNPSPAYPSRSVYKILTTPSSRRRDYEFQSGSTDQPEQFAAVQRANSEDYQDLRTIAPADGVLDD